MAMKENENGAQSYLLLNIETNRVCGHFINSDFGFFRNENYNS